MDKAKIFLEDGVEKVVNCIFYIYNSKYYFLYTLNELDENGYVKLYLAKVGKETIDTSNGVIETGNMLGIEIPTLDEWKEVQDSITKIVNSKKTKIEDKNIQNLPLNMLVNLKIVSKKTFRLLANIIENDFGVNISEKLNELNNTVVDANDNVSNNKTDELVEVVVPIPDSVEDNKKIEDSEINSASEKVETEIELQQEDPKKEDTPEIDDSQEDDESDVIIDYRTRFFEEQEKNKRLNEEIEELKKKLKSIDEIIKGD